MLAYDGSREGLAALREGCALARRSEAAVLLLAIIPWVPVPDGVGGSIVVEGADKTILAEGVAAVSAAGLTVTAELVRGESAHDIGKRADRFGADLVVVGHQKKSILARWWAGPGLASLAEELSCSVLIARNRDEGASTLQSTHS